MVKRLDDLRKQMKAGSMEELQKLAETQGISWEEFKQNTKNAILTQKVIGSEVGGHIQITNEEIQKYYDEHKADFSQAERVRLSEILVANDPKAPKDSTADATPEQVAAAQAKANDIYSRLKGGAHFEEIARSESNGTTAAEGGDLGYFKRHELAKELEGKTFALESGQYTQPIRTRQGFIILRVSDHIEAGTSSMDRVREQIQDLIYTQRVQPALRQYLTKLREEAYIDVRSGYADKGASPNQTGLVYTAEAGPETKEVRGKLGLGKKKTVVVVPSEKNLPSGSTSDLGSAKADVEAKSKTESDKKTAEDAAAAKAAADAAEQEKLSNMSPRERDQYLAAKKLAEKKQAQQEARARSRAKEAAEEKAESNSDLAHAAHLDKKHKTPEEAAAAAAEEEKIGKMSLGERRKYLAQKRNAAHREALAQRRQKELAEAKAEDAADQTGNPWRSEKPKPVKKAATAQAKATRPAAKSSSSDGLLTKLGSKLGIIKASAKKRTNQAPAKRAATGKPSVDTAASKTAAGQTAASTSESVHNAPSTPASSAKTAAATSTDTAADKAAAEKAEQEKISQMSPRERANYLAEKQLIAKKEAKEAARGSRGKRESAKKGPQPTVQSQPQASQAQTAAPGGSQTESASTASNVRPPARSKKPRTRQEAKTGSKSAPVSKTQADKNAGKNKEAKKTKEKKPAKSDATEQANASGDSSNGSSGEPSKKKKFSWF